MRNKILLSVLSGLMMALAFPLFSLWPLSFLTLVPLYFAVENVSIRRSFFLSWVCGLVFFTGLLYWIVLNPAVEAWVRPLLYLGVALIAAYLSLYLATAAAVAGWLSRKAGLPLWIFMPFSLVLADYLRSHGILAFPWGSLGYSLARWTSAVQPASVAGIYGITFWIVMVNGLVFWLCKLLKEKRFLRFDTSFAIRSAIVILALILPLLAGKLMLAEIHQKIRTAPYLNVALIQGNIEQGLRWDREFQDYNWRTYDSLSRRAIERPEKIDLLVWPETALPFYLRYEPNYYLRSLALANELNTGILTGVPDFSYDPKTHEQSYYNAAFLILPGSGLAGAYSKSHLVPFGERFPYKEKIPFLRNVDFGEGEWTPGPDSVVFKMDGLVLSCMICFESIFPEIARKQAGKEASLFVNITNDGWFGRSGAARQHAEMAVFRAVEQRRSVARCANSGISMFILPTGEIVKPTRLYEQTVIFHPVPLMNTSTFYQRHGDLFLLLVAASFIFAVLLFILKPLFLRK